MSLFSNFINSVFSVVGRSSHKRQDFLENFICFRAVLEANHVWIIVIAVINSAISFYYYLRVVISMFTPEKETAVVPSAKLSLSVFVVLLVTLLGSLWLGLFPEVFLNLAQTLSIASS